jgi:two-component system, OmpR family, KDP operon response regulator KdpE
MNQTPDKILVVDDDSSIRRALHTTLGALGFEVEEARDGEAALRLVRARQFDAVLLDINMPGMGGIETCRQLRRLGPVLPIVMLTVRDSQDDIVRTLDAGADDYITKPFHIRELVARLKAAVRRSRALGNVRTLFSIGDVELDPERRTVKKRGQLIRLTPKEFDVLHYLMANAGMPIPHARLLQAVWGPEYGNELEYLRTFVRQLRLKIEDDPSHPTYLLTDPYVGYRFYEPSGSDAQPIAVKP